jgi:hypothetical protein
MSYKDLEENRECPFGANILEKILPSSSRRKIIFNCMIFTPDHCRTLASSGTKTNIIFCNCEFQDGGAAFVEASAARRDITSGPANLRFEFLLPFNARNLALFLSQHKLESLVLHRIHLDTEVSRRAVKTALVRCLKLQYCKLEDRGTALVESVREEGRGPQELCFSGNPFGSRSSFVTFINRLRSDEHLERLHLSEIDDSQVTRALAAALHGNKGLVHLTVCFRALDGSDWTELFKAISLHPSLRSLDLKMSGRGIDVKKRRGFTKAVADMLSVNERVEVVSFNAYTFHKSDWDVFVAPRLECNKYRKLFPSIQKMGDESTRAAVSARALTKFAIKPHLVWMLLSQNHDIVSSYLDAARDQVSQSLTFPGWSECSSLNPMN